MEKIPAMTSMAKDAKEVDDIPTVADCVPMYPYGLCISLCQDELEKLGYEASDFDPEDIVHLHCLAMVTSVSTSKSASGDDCSRIELQITNIACESEDEENEEVESKGSKRLSKMYI